METGYRLSSVGSLDSRSGLVHFTLMVKVFPLASLKNDKLGDYGSWIPTFVGRDWSVWIGFSMFNSNVNRYLSTI